MTPSRWSASGSCPSTWRRVVTEEDFSAAPGAGARADVGRALAVGVRRDPGGCLAAGRRAALSSVRAGGMWLSALVLALVRRAGDGVPAGLFFVFPFYVVLAVTFGTLDPILRQPGAGVEPVRGGTRRSSPSRCRTSRTPMALLGAVPPHLRVTSGRRRSLCLLIGYPFAYFLARHAGRAQGAVPGAVLRAVLDLLHAADARVDGRCWRTMGTSTGPAWASASSATPLPVPRRASPARSSLGLVYGYVPFMVLPLYATLDRLPGRPAGGGPRPRGEPGANVLPRDAPAVAAGDPGRS